MLYLQGTAERERERHTEIETDRERERERPTCQNVKLIKSNFDSDATLLSCKRQTPVLISVLKDDLPEVPASIWLYCPNVGMFQA